MIEVKDLHFSYHLNNEVLKGVNFTLKEGETLCLLGSNGTGKTTLIRCLLGFSLNKHGAIMVEGQPLSRLSARKKAHFMAYVPQSSSLAFPYRVNEVVMMGRVAHLGTGAGHSKKDREAVAHALRRLQIDHLSDRRYQELSGGEKQMVLVARALAQEAKYLIMDEPTANLDYHNQVKILTAVKYLATQGFGILMTSHYPDHAFLACSSVGLMKSGRIEAFGSPDEVVTTESLSKLYETPVHVIRAEVGTLSIKTCIPLLDENVFAQSTSGSE